MDIPSIRFWAFFVFMPLGVAAVVVGVLALLSNLLRSRPWIAFLLVPLSSSIMYTSYIAWDTWRTGVGVGFDYTSPLDDRFLEGFWPLLAGGIILGGIVGLLACAGTLLWRGARRSRWRTAIGVTLVVLSWVTLGLSLLAEILFMMLWRMTCHRC